jgi:hypothetical protein
VTPRERDEYRALRATIRARGTARVWIVLAGTVAWAALTLATAALAQLPIATLLPLLVLALTFEITASLHQGVERIGRYLQVFFETEAGGWEHVAMAYGRQFPGAGIDPLFSPFFWLAAVFNFVPVVTAGPVLLEWTVVGTIHLLFMTRVYFVRREAAHQRAVDLERFERLKSGART